MKAQTLPQSKSLFYEGAKWAALLTLASILIGGVFDWIYLNTQESQMSLVDAQSDYLGSYASAFLIAAIEIGAAYYFIEKYDFGDRRKFFIPAVYAGFAAFLFYTFGELAAGISSSNGVQIPLGQFLYYELAPGALDYGNAIIMLFDLFALALLLKVLLRVNPLPNAKASLPNSAGFFGGVWTSAVTSASAVVCCGPLPGAIALATGVSSIYFTDLINIQSFIVLVSIPLLLVAIFLADKRAMKGCKLRDRQ